MYLETNSFYGWAMSQYLPYGNFKWMSEIEINKSDLASIKENSLDGYILEVDLEYPSELHNLHNDYPLDPEKRKINQNVLSKYCFDIANKYGIKIGEVPNLGNKEKYVIH